VRLDPEETAAVVVAAKLQPLEPDPGSGAPWKCMCLTCGNEMTPAYAAARVGHGCRFCNLGGFDYTAPGVVYLVTNAIENSLKVGITTSASRIDRVAEHESRGWELAGSWSVGTGDNAECVEQSIIRWWRDELDAPSALLKSVMPQGGHTEIASLVLVDLDETIARIQAEVDRLDEQ
jgi:hypothetical protein